MGNLRGGGWVGVGGLMKFSADTLSLRCTLTRRQAEQS